MENAHYYEGKLPEPKHQMGAGQMSVSGPSVTSRGRDCTRN